MAVWSPALENPSGGRYPSYQLCTAYDSQVFVHTIAFDIGKMSYALTSDAMQFPASGLQRKHLCGVVKNGFLVTGTAAGDMCIFSLAGKVFRAAVPVCNNGVVSLTQAGDTLFAGGGDGRIKALRGSDTHWDVLLEQVLESGIVALTASADGGELVAGCRNGKLFRARARDLSAVVLAVTHTDEVTSVAFGRGDRASEAVCTCSAAGEVFYLDLSSYMPIMAATARSPARSVAMATSGQEILAGFDDGNVLAYSPANGRVLWSVQAHRGGVTCLRESPDFVVTGGHDCAVRFFHRTTHELLSQFTVHRKPVADLLVDAAAPHLVHSGAEDKLVATYDLRANKVLVQHGTQHSNVTGLSQRKDRDAEVVSSSLDGKILFWDVDYPDPRGCLDTPEGALVRFRCVEVSPRGRYIAAGAEDARLFLFDLTSCSCIQVCEGHSGAITHLRWSPDERQVITAGKDGCVIVWNFFEPGGR
eukprot:SRR837773.20724.p1 GENE.SRR837773.20724~~SRR837773.20724.p1  ORF type:complete len:526 (-),score=181.08 SRR837773.20724:90-1511(-)